MRNLPSLSTLSLTGQRLHLKKKGIKHEGVAFSYSYESGAQFISNWVEFRLEREPLAVGHYSPHSSQFIEGVNCKIESEESLALLTDTSSSHSYQLFELAHHFPQIAVSLSSIRDLELKASYCSNSLPMSVWLSSPTLVMVHLSFPGASLQVSFSQHL